MDHQILNRIIDRKVSIIGIEGFRLEAAVLSVLKTLPNFVYLQNKSYDELKEYIENESFKRDLKLRGLLNGGKINLIIDMNSISAPKSSEPYFVSQTRLFTELRQKVISNDHSRYTGTPAIEINLIFVMMVHKNLKLNSGNHVTVPNTGL